MIIDVTGVVLLPGNGGRDCPGNGTGVDIWGSPIECCCDECDYLMCCTEETQCDCCIDADCPRSHHL